MPRWIVWRAPPRASDDDRWWVTPLVVLLVAGMAIAAVAPQWFSRVRMVKISHARLQIYRVQEAAVHYMGDHVSSVGCPSSLQTLVDTRYLAAWPRDPWGHPLSYDCPGAHTPDGPDIVSAGPDGRFGTADDIRSWELDR